MKASGENNNKDPVKELNKDVSQSASEASTQGEAAKDSIGVFRINGVPFKAALCHPEDNFLLYFSRAPDGAITHLVDGYVKSRQLLNRLRRRGYAIMREKRKQKET